MYCVHDCYKRFVNTYNKIISSSLIQKTSKINVVLVGPEKEKLKEELKYYHKVETFLKPVGKSESESLRMMWDHSQNNSGNVLYLHSKGVTKPQNSYIKDWVNLMEYFLIEKYEMCLESLNNHDVCGVNFLPGRPHFSGNFWWSTCDHLKRLKCLTPEKVDRLYCEYWLFDIDKEIKRKEIYNSGLDHYKNLYPKEKYVLKNN